MNLRSAPHLQRRAALAVLGLQASARRHQRPHRLCVPSLGGLMQRQLASGGIRGASSQGCPLRVSGGLKDNNVVRHIAGVDTCMRNGGATIT